MTTRRVPGVTFTAMATAMKRARPAAPSRVDEERADGQAGDDHVDLALVYVVEERIGAHGQEDGCRHYLEPTTGLIARRHGDQQREHADT